MAARPKLFGYENALLLMMCLCNGVVALDRLTTNFLAKPIQDAFHLSNAQLGLLASALSIVIAPSGFLVAALADSTRQRKLILLIALFAFSIFSALPAVVFAYPLLLGSRLLLGAAEGPILPVAQSVMAMESSPARRGFNMGIMQNLGAAGLGVMLGPILFSELATRFGWRAAFLASGVPGVLLVVALMAWMRPVKEPAAATAHAPGSEGRIGEVLKSRNLQICVAIAGLFSAWLLVQGVFLALYLQTKDGLSLREAGRLIAITGVSQLVAGTVVPALSDKIGRKPALFALCAIGVLAPVLTVLTPGSSPLLGVALFVGWLGGGAGPLYVSIIPSESVPPRHAATAIAVSLASGEIVGGVVAPALAGRAADLFGLAAPFWITAAAAAICAVLTLFLKETAPRRQPGAALADLQP